jgi:hypothetical protein
MDVFLNNAKIELYLVDGLGPISGALLRSDPDSETDLDRRSSLLCNARPSIRTLCPKTSGSNLGMNNKRSDAERDELFQRFVAWDRQRSAAR